MSGNYNNDYFQSSYYSRQEKSKYRLEQSWITYSNPSSNGIPPDRREFRANENERIVFSYDENHSYGPSDWGRINPNCNGSSQSPVNLNTYLARTVSTRQPLIIDGFYSLPSSIRIENNGHSAALRFRFANEKPIRLIGGPLKVPYIVDNVHWHWGESDYAGSEHLLDARRYSAEVHFVTYNSDYSKLLDRRRNKETISTFQILSDSLAEASLMSKGIAVLAFFYEVIKFNNFIAKQSCSTYSASNSWTIPWERLTIVLSNFFRESENRKAHMKIAETRSQ